MINRRIYPFKSPLEQKLRTTTLEKIREYFSEIKVSICFPLNLIAAVQKQLRSHCLRFFQTATQLPPQTNVTNHTSSDWSANSCKYAEFSRSMLWNHKKALFNPVGPYLVAMETCELRVLGGVLWTMVFSESDKPSFYAATPTQR